MRSKISSFVNCVISVIYKEILEARARIELANKGFADLCLTTWLPRPDCRRAGTQGEELPSWQTLARWRGLWNSLERETGFEPATSTLARSHSTTELLPLDCFILDKALCSVKPMAPLNCGFPAYLLLAPLSGRRRTIADPVPAPPPGRHENAECDCRSAPPPGL